MTTDGIPDPCTTDRLFDSGLRRLWTVQLQFMNVSVEAMLLHLTHAAEHALDCVRKAPPEDKDAHVYVVAAFNDVISVIERLKFEERKQALEEAQRAGESGPSV